jgi:hypothetical protein
VNYGPEEGKYGLKVTDSKGSSGTNWYTDKSNRDQEYKRQLALSKRPGMGISKVEKVSR